jgi:hypothetical protein
MCSVLSEVYYLSYNILITEANKIKLNEATLIIIFAICSDYNFVTSYSIIKYGKMCNKNNLKLYKNITNKKYLFK